MALHNSRGQQTGNTLNMRYMPRASMGLAVLCAIVLTMGALFYVWQRYQFTRLGFELGQLRARKAQLEARLEPLEVEASYLARPERIHTLATGELGMRPPRAGQVIDVIGYELIPPAVD